MEEEQRVFSKNVQWSISLDRVNHKSLEDTVLGHFCCPAVFPLLCGQVILIISKAIKHLI